MEQHNYDLQDKIITLNDYKFNRNPPPEYGLHNKVVCYFDGYNRKMIPLSVMLTFPIMYDKYVGSDEQFHDMTIALCPFTLAVAVFDGIFIATENVENSCLVISNNKYTFPIIHSQIEVKKFEADIKVLRNVFTEYPDSKYMILNNNKSVNPILGNEYYENQTILFNCIKPSDQFHTKTLIYLILYQSSKDQTIKSTVIVGSNACANEVTGYNIVESGVYNYLTTYNDKIKEKLGLVMPMVWFAWKSFYPNSKIIYIPK